jgi:hypothetical protein
MLLFGRILLHTEPGIYMIAHLCREENYHLGGIKKQEERFLASLPALYVVIVFFI